MRYFIIAGEQSGDLHGSNLIRGIRKSDSSADIACWGGDLMQEAGGKLQVHYRKLAFMGFVNVILNIFTISRYLKLCRHQIIEFSPDALILIDYPGFNLRMARFAKSNGIKVLYYISPKFWAWNEGRIEKVKRFVDNMFIIFPFEVEFYRKHGMEVKYYGNPLVDEIHKKIKMFPDKKTVRKELGVDDNKPVIALMAGSREHEVRLILPQMIKAVKYFTEYQFVLACLKRIPEKLYSDIIGEAPVKMVYDRNYELLMISEASLVKSGTSTLEAALLGVPQVVCYKGDRISYEIARRLVNVRFISLVNLIMGREVVKELIQDELAENRIVNELRRITGGGNERIRMLKDYDELSEILGPPGASSRIAEVMVRIIRT